jgi:hypothetical protein
VGEILVILGLPLVVAIMGLALVITLGLVSQQGAGHEL